MEKRRARGSSEPAAGSRAGARRGGVEKEEAAPAPVPVIDELDHALIELVRKNPKASNTAIADELGIAKTTVAARIRKLSDQKIMRIVASFDLGAVGYDLLSIVMVQVRRRPLADVARDLVQMPEVLSVQSILGPVNMVLLVAARSRKHLLHVIENEVGSIAGIEGIRCEQLLATEVVRAEWGILEEKLPPAISRSFFDEFDREDGPTEFDAVDRTLIAHLQEDGRTPLTRIATSAGVSEGTIRTRLKRLEAERHLRILALSDSRSVGFTANAFLSVNVGHQRLSTTATALAQLPQVAMVAVSHSATDIWAFVLARSDEELLSLISDDISTLPGVESATPYPVVDYYKMDHRWIQQLD